MIYKLETNVTKFFAILVDKSLKPILYSLNLKSFNYMQFFLAFFFILVQVTE